MENSVNSRILQLIRVLRMSNSAFGKSLSKTSTTINSIVAGKNKPSFEVLEAICEVHNVSPVWLMKGEGEMFVQPSAPAPTAVAPDQYLQDHVKQLEQSFERLASQLETKDRQIEKLLDLLGKLDLGENSPWDLVRQLHQKMAA